LSLPFEFLDTRPIVLALAGSNGAGKSTFYETFLADSGLRFLNADVLSASLNVSAYEAAELASSLRSALVAQRESFIFETAIAQDWRTPAANPKLKPEEAQCQPMKRNPVGPLIKISSMVQSS
jgi:ABC-type hemin transport system ATPase subunit